MWLGILGAGVQGCVGFPWNCRAYPLQPRFSVKQEVEERGGVLVLGEKGGGIGAQIFWQTFGNGSLHSRLHTVLPVCNAKV